jgi:predicted acyl esterase
MLEPTAILICEELRLPGRAVTRMITAALAVMAGALALSSSALAGSPQPFGHACTAQNGVRFCPTTGSADRVPTFDGIPLDADVTLPPEGKGPFPTIVMIHGYGGSKTDFEGTSPGDGQDYNNVFYAQRGYAVLNYTARGFGNSCGGGPSGDHAGACGQGYIRLADSRYEARDTQYLLGKLADQGITAPKRIGVTGISYGGGQSTELAFLHNKIRKPSGALAPWVSPKGLHMRIAAAYPRWPWTDLVDALLPNGRFLDTEVAPKKQSLDPVGVPIQSYIAGLYALGNVTGYYCGGAPASTPCTESDFNLTTKFAEVNAGQPMTPVGLADLAETYTDKAGYPVRFMKGASKPAPLLYENGWTDDLFPPEQALRVYNYLRAAYKHPDVSLQFGDLGHSRGTNKDATDKYLDDQGAAFFDAHLKGGKGAPAPGSVTTFNQTCPPDKPDRGPFHARSWPAISHADESFGSNAPQTFTSTGGDPSVSAAFDPIGGTTDSCKTISTTQEPNTATYDDVLDHGVTMTGLPTIQAQISTIGDFGQIDARLWDISPKGTQRLVTRGVYSLENGQTGDITFQLHGNGYRFAKGHTAELELLGRDVPYYQASNGAFSVTVSNLTVDLPKLAPGA